MKNKYRFLFCTLIPIGLTSLLSMAAGDVTKADNATALNLGGSYVGGVAPVSTDLLIIDGTLTAVRTASLGDDLSVLGVSASSARTFTIGATTGKTLTIGASGINKSGAGELTLNNATSLGGNISLPITGSGRINVGGALTLTTNQTWGLGINRITVNNTINTGGNTLAITGGNGSIIAIYAANTLGSEVTISNGGNLWIGAPGAGVVTINGVNNTNASVSLFTGTLNIAAMGNLNGASSIGKSSLNIRAQTTLNYTGNTTSSDKGMIRDTNGGLSLGDTTFNVTTAGQTLTMSGTFAHQGTSQTGAWIFGGAGNLTLTGAVQNGASTKVIKNDAGTLTLSGTNTYASTTTVNGGTLLVNGSHNIATAGADYTAKAGATLGGTGRIAINGNVTLESTSVLAPGASIGALTLDGVNSTGNILTMATGSTFAIELDGSGGTSDRLDFWNLASGDLALNNNAINFSLLGTQTPGTYTVDIFRFFSDSGASGTSHGFSSGLAIGSLDPNISSAAIDWDGTANNGQTIALTYTVIPEPSVAVLVGAMGVLSLLRRRRDLVSEF